VTLAGGPGAGLEGTEDQRPDGLGRQAGFGWVAQTREMVKGPAPGHRWARDLLGQPSNPPSEGAMNRVLHSALFLPNSLRIPFE
jgi:hypothetical protein